MNELTFSILRFIFLGFLWSFVIVTIILVRKDIFTSSIKTRNKISKKSKYSEAMFMVVSGPLKGSQIPLSNESITIGRKPYNTIIIDDDFASSDHAKVFLHKKDWYIEDLNSTNGTLVNSKKIKKPTKLNKNSKIDIGNSRMRIQF